MNIINTLDEIGSYIINSPKQFIFNTIDLPDVNNFNTDIVQHQSFSPLFYDLLEIKENCIYWFELESPEKCQTLLHLLESSRERLKQIPRVVPPNNSNMNSKCFYVGIRRGGYRKKDNFTNIAGRIGQHLGYYDKGTTQGLQLVHWAKEAKANITINYAQLNGIPNQYLNVLEGIIAHQLRPLCGHH